MFQFRGILNLVAFADGVPTVFLPGTNLVSMLSPHFPSSDVAILTVTPPSFLFSPGIASRPSDHPHPSNLLFFRPPISRTPPDFHAWLPSRRPPPVWRECPRPPTRAAIPPPLFKRKVPQVLRVSHNLFFTMPIRPPSVRWCSISPTSPRWSILLPPYLIATPSFSSPFTDCGARG